MHLLYYFYFLLLSLSAHITLKDICLWLTELQGTTFVFCSRVNTTPSPTVLVLPPALAKLHLHLREVVHKRYDEENGMEELEIYIN